MAKKSERRAVKLPEGYADEEEFLAEARERWQQGVDADQENREQGIEDLKFLAGDQWDTQAKADRAGRPCLTINQMPSFVAQVVGDIRLNRPSIKASAVEDNDKDLADVREGLIRFIERDNDALGHYVTTGENQVACGIGNYRLGLKYASGLSFDREITLSAIADAFAVVWDPMSIERTGRDARFCFVNDSMPRKAFEKAYKDQIADSGFEVPQHDSGGWYTSDDVRITEYWLMQTRKVKIALLDGGQVVKADDVPQGAVVVAEREADEPYCCMYLITGKAILAGPFELPIDRVPIFRAVGWVVTIQKKRVRWGLLRFAKDPQRLKNYWRSVSAEMLALAPKGKWLLPETEEGNQDGFRNAHANDDTVLTYSGPNKPEYVGPPQLNTAVLNEASMNTQDIKDVTGLHDASLGVRSNETSGKAILARQKEGDVANFIYADNLAAAIKEGGRVMDALISVVYDTRRTIRILGVDETAKTVKVNDPNDPNAYDLNRGRYDIAIETGPSYSTKRAEAADAMRDMVQAVPAIGQVAGDLLVKAQEWPDADRIAERLHKMLPPQLQEKEEGADGQPPSPEQQAQAQAAQQQAQIAQQAQQMAAQKAELDLKEQEAKVLQAQAQAAKADAEAKEAQFNLGLLVGEHALEDDDFGQGAPAPEDTAMGEASAAA